MYYFEEKIESFWFVKGRLKFLASNIDVHCFMSVCKIISFVENEQHGWNA